jgi:hypothetical protein
MCVVDFSIACHGVIFYLQYAMRLYYMQIQIFRYIIYALLHSYLCRYRMYVGEEVPFPSVLPKDFCSFEPKTVHMTVNFLK